MHATAGNANMRLEPLRQMNGAPSPPFV